MLRLLMVALVLAGLSGCRGEGPYAVRGSVVDDVDGKPIKELAGFTITFTSETCGKSATGNLDEKGDFRLTSSRNGDGAFPGDYKVVLTQPQANPERGEYRQAVVDVGYEHPRTTKLRARVEPKGNTFTFHVKRLPPE